ncbi:amidase family protein [Gaetbulibacter aestuarii]|uniref:Amidase family protein n=1 Tax=Gaetbulibacter aestuarii TaxID=1502358 RepID=A0ABW7MYM6_9FLAO
MKYLLYALVIVSFLSCKKDADKSTNLEQSASDTTTVATKDLREFKVLDSKYINNDIFWAPINDDLADFSESDYEVLKPLIIDQDIPALQKSINTGKLSYEKLTKFYLYRIRKFDRENDLSLNSVISINPDAIADAKQKDRELLNRKLKHPIFGMPVLLKDNINATGMPTTAGAVALINNMTGDAFITKQLKKHGAVILGKTNLSEWANFLSANSSNGYSAVGGQTLNPYGRRVIDTGGSSSGSGVAVAANFCAAAVGSETAGSILSPSSQNSVVGLKPTIGLLSRSGIVPISSTLDTPGPMARNVTDDAIMLDAMLGYDPQDSKSMRPDNETPFYKGLSMDALKGKRFGALKSLMEDSLYVAAVTDLKAQGAAVVEIEGADIKLPNFLRLLNLDMQKDLPAYFSKFGGKDLTVSDMQDVIDFNKKDSLNTIPYGQALFLGAVADHATPEEFQTIKDSLKINGRLFFDVPMKANNLDGILSINNYHAGFAAVAEYPAITVPMGYNDTGAPEGLTFISKPRSEKQLLDWAYAYEQASKNRISPKNYK